MRRRLLRIAVGVLVGLLLLSAGVVIGIEVEYMACVEVHWIDEPIRVEPEGAVMACR